MMGIAYHGGFLPAFRCLGISVRKSHAYSLAGGIVCRANRVGHDAALSPLTLWPVVH